MGMCVLSLSRTAVNLAVFYLMTKFHIFKLPIYGLYITGNGDNLTKQRTHFQAHSTCRDNWIV